MKTASLSTEQAPPISVPLRFFAVAPLFLALSALILAFADDPSDAHSPALLAATHCITLGFMALVMLGAVQQILPVVIGSQMPASRWVAWFSFLPLIVGTLSLAGGFLLSNPMLLNLACWLLGLAFLTFIGACLISLARAPARNATKTALLLAISALALAVTLGIVLAHGYANGLPLNYPQLASAHIALALGGWVAMLIIGVSFQVVPMFQLTPNYPKWLSAGLTPALFAALLLFLASRLLDSVPLGYLAETLFGLSAVSFALVTLKLQSQRRRRVADATLSFFRLGMISLLLTAALSLLALYSPALFRTPAIVTFILGFALSVIHGMLYKIIPFLIWFHLFRGGIKKGIPNMKEILPEAWMWRHWWLHLATLLAALLAICWSAAVWLVATGLALQGVLLGAAIFTGIAVYRRTLKRIETVSP